MRSFTSDRRVIWVELASSAAILAIILVNALLPVINRATGLLELPYILPAIRPVGVDFRIGLFYPAKAILAGADPYASRVFPYPPFAAVFAIPFRLFTVENAYLIQVALLFISNVVAVLLSVHIAHMVTPTVISKDAPDKYSLATSTFWQVLVLTLTSYGFIFSIERGNFDIYPMVFCLLALWLLIKKPGWLWPQVILIAIASQLKIYPAILFILLIWKHGWKSLLPIFLVNGILLLITGPANLVHFFNYIVSYSSNPFIFIANHSAASFASLVNNFLVGRLGISIPSLLFIVVPVVIWLVGALILWKRKYSPLNATLLFMISIPLMNLLPSISHDYKLVILSSALAMCLLLQTMEFVHSGRARSLVIVGVLIALMFIMTRSYTMLPVILGNKYPFILLMEGSFVLSLLTMPRPPTEAELLSNNRSEIPA